MFGAAGTGGMGGLLSNPDAMREIMESPMMASLMDNPDLMRSMMMVRGWAVVTWRRFPRQPGAGKG